MAIIPDKEQSLTRNKFRFMKILSSEQPVKTQLWRGQQNAGGEGFDQVTLLRTWDGRLWRTARQSSDFQVFLHDQVGNKHRCSKRGYRKSLYLTIKTLSELECTRQAASKIPLPRA